VYQDVQAAAERRGITVQSISVQSLPDDIPGALDEAAAGQADAVLQLIDGVFTADDTQLVATLAIQRRLPFFAPGRPEVVNGGLLTLAPVGYQPVRLAVTYVDKILKGAKPGDLAITAPLETEIVLNQKTAAAIGFSFPDSVLAKATDIIR
jgi:putative ABC transport system substrate-binding protein